MPRTSPLSALIALVLTAHPAPTRADGLPDLAFGTDGFVQYEHSPIAEEPNIERGLRLGRSADGEIVALAQHRYDDAAASNGPLLVRFAPGGALRGANLFVAGFPSPPDPPITATDLDANRRAIFIGESGGGTSLELFTAVPVMPGSNFVPNLQASIPPETGQGDFHRAVVGLPDGGIVVCGMRQTPFATGLTQMPLCRRFTAEGFIDFTFGNESAFAGPGVFFLNDSDLPGLQAGRILAAGVDRQGRLLLGGSIRIEGVASELAFSARLLPQGDFDPDYCPDPVCSDATATAPGWRADAISDATHYTEGALIERPDGVVARAYDVERESNAQPQVALTFHADDGALQHGDTLQLGEWTRVGGQLGVLSDERLILPLSYRVDATTQYGALARVNAQPAVEGLLDLTFAYAPSGVTQIAGISVIRPSLVTGPATSVECNAVLVDSDRLTCAGLVRVGDAPVNVDLLLARVQIEAPEPLFEDGFE